LHRVELELERGHDPEVAPASPHTPEEVFVLSMVGANQLPVRGYHLDRGDVVERQPESSRDPPEPTARRQPTHTGVRHGPERRHQPVLLSRPVHVSQQGSSRDHGPPFRGIDPHSAEAGQVDHHPAVAGRLSGEAVPAALDRREEGVLPSERYRGLDFGGAGRLGDQGRMLVDGRIENAARFFVTRALRQQQLAAEARAELPDRRSLDGDFTPISSDGLQVARGQADRAV